MCPALAAELWVDFMICLRIILLCCACSTRQHAWADRWQILACYIYQQYIYILLHIYCMYVHRAQGLGSVL